MGSEMEKDCGEGSRSLPRVVSPGFPVAPGGLLCGANWAIHGRQDCWQHCRGVHGSLPGDGKPLSGDASTILLYFPLQYGEKRNCYAIAFSQVMFNAPVAEGCVKHTLTILRTDVDSIRIAIVGVGNCASSLLQGIEYQGER